MSNTSAITSAMSKNIRWLALILIACVFFYWKILLTHQFTILAEPEIVNQAYSWNHFCASTIRQGNLPFWDPFAHSGRTFVAGMETGAFYPLKLLLYLWPLNSSHLLSPQLFQDYYVLAHILAAFFLFLLAREIHLAGFPAFLAALCFSLGGFMSRIPWQDMLDSSIWLPLILLFLLRALHSRGLRATLYSCLAGLALGLSILAGRIHIVIMDVLVILSLVGYVAFLQARKADSTGRGFYWRRAALIVALVGVVGLTFGAVQLLPTIEYGPLAIRYIGASAPVNAVDRIPYEELRDPMLPRSLLGFLFLLPFGGLMGGEVFTPYMGVLPLMLSLFGVWRGWGNMWVRYFTGLAVATFFYTLGPYSFLHGLAYAVVPFLWIVRNAGRFLYLTHFAVALLAGFGAQSLFEERGSVARSDTGFIRVLMWLTIAVSAAMALPAIYNKLDVNEWMYFSLLFIIVSSGALILILKGHSTPATRFLVTVVILCDLSGSYFFIQNKIRLQKSGTNYLETILRSHAVAEFLKMQPGLFRIHMESSPWPNIGDLYGVQLTEGTTATELRDYYRFRRAVPRFWDFMNVRYFVRMGSAGQPDPVYSDQHWKVYENRSCLPRAWVVHQAVVEPSEDSVFGRLRDPGFDPLQIALVADNLGENLEPAVEGLQEEVRFESYRPNRLELRVQAGSRGLLVLSEMFFPGWKATVNGRVSPIHKTDGLLRGIVIPDGESRVILQYAPISIMIGAILTFLAPLATLTIAFISMGRKSPGITHGEA